MRLKKKNCNQKKLQNEILSLEQNTTVGVLKLFSKNYAFEMYWTTLTNIIFVKACCRIPNIAAFFASSKSRQSLFNIGYRIFDNFRLWEMNIFLFWITKFECTWSYAVKNGVNSKRRWKYLQKFNPTFVKFEWKTDMRKRALKSMHAVVNLLNRAILTPHKDSSTTKVPYPSNYPSQTTEKHVILCWNSSTMTDTGELHLSRQLEHPSRSHCARIMKAAGRK